MNTDKGALSLIADYGGDSSEEEVPGTRASTKRMSKVDDEKELQTKRFARLPKPNFHINDLEAVVDDPSLHEGRVRSFAHERGSWATYAFIPYENNEALEILLSLVNRATSLESFELKYFKDFHITLTRTVVLRHHWIDSFVVTLKGNLLPFGKFMIMLDSLQIYCNEEKTRTFVGLHIKTGYDSLLKLVKCLDNCLAEFNLPKFYDSPSFHISIAWCLGDCREKLQSILPVLNYELEELMNKYSQEYWYIYVEKIMCKIGNKLYQFQLG